MLRITAVACLIIALVVAVWLSAGAVGDAPVEPTRAATPTGASGTAIPIAGGEPERVAVAEPGASESGAGSRATATAQLEVRGRVLGAGDQPLAGATVRCRTRATAASPDGAPAASDSWSEATTARDGGFALWAPHLAGATLTLLVAHAEHAPLHAMRTNVAPDARAVDFGDLRLSRGGEVDGRVVDAHDNGIAGARVRLDAEHRSGSSRRRAEGLQPVEVTTDASGGFHARHLPAGSYHADVRADGYLQRLGEPFEIAEEQRTTLPAIQLAAGAVLHGVVTDDRGAAIADAEVRIDFTTDSGSRRNHRVDTDAHGSFRLPHCPAAAVELRVRATGYLSFEERAADPRRSPWTITLQPGLAARGRVVDARTGAPVLHYAAAIRRIAALTDADRRRARLDSELATLAGAAAEAQRRGDARAAAALERRIEELRGVRDRSVASADDALRYSPRRPRRRALPPAAAHPGGAFEFSGLDEGIYVVDVASDAHILTCTPPFALTRHRALDPLQVALEPGLRVAGVVSAAPGGDGIAGVRIGLVDLSEATDRPRLEVGSTPERRAPIGRTIAECESTADGSFALPPVEPGRYALRAVRGRFAATDTAPFELRTDRSDVVLELRALAALYGTVHRPAPGATVRVTVFGGAGRSRSTTAHSDGSFVFEELEPGGYLVFAYSTSFQPTYLRRLVDAYRESAVPRADVVLSPGARVRFDPPLHVEHLGIVAGTALVDGAPRAGLSVELLPERQARHPVAAEMEIGIRSRATTDTEGGFRIDAVPEGSYQLIVRTGESPFLVLHARDVAVARDAETWLSLTIQTAQIRLQLVDAASEPVDATGRMLLRGGAEGPDTDARAFPIRAGVGTMVDLMPGRYQARLQLDDGRVVEREIVLHPGDNQTSYPVVAPASRRQP